MYPRSWKGSDIDLGCFQSLFGTAGRLAPGGGFRRTYFGVARLGVEPAGERDLVAKVRHYLADEEARTEIAAAGAAHARANYTAAAFWRLVLARALPALEWEVSA